jgi:hypothetical protein
MLASGYKLDEIVMFEEIHHAYLLRFEAVRAGGILQYHAAPGVSTVVLRNLDGSENLRAGLLLTHQLGGFEKGLEIGLRLWFLKKRK